MNFEPPISERNTDELIQIANFPDDWNPIAVEHAKNELLVRNVSPEYQSKKVSVLKRYKQKKKGVTNKRKANERYYWHDFIFRLDDVLVEMLFDWDMKKDGYLKKHQQRKYTFAVIGLAVVVVYVLLN
ncbi:hypothetical protein [uncultured Pontibacter sp.]|uniref:hypothetical protein n=1 Tax=uncultured Pontibacter sp. TaxID=453356 RepID=UPI00261BBE3B|nr:hypothetical protein [uncultured Pontibacter sp.]